MPGACRTRLAPSGRLPLEGVTVLEMAVLYAAPFGAALVTDLGARVIRIEQLAGDPCRLMAGFSEAGGAKPTQGKEYLAVDIAAPEARSRPGTPRRTASPHWGWRRRGCWVWLPATGVPADSIWRVPQ
jgi:hypothetical protein